MSSAVVSTSAALGRPFLFDDEPDPEVFCHPERSEKCVKRISRGVEGSLPNLETSFDPRLASIAPASRLEIRPAPEMVTTGIPALDALTGGLPRGCLTEIYGPVSSGRTSVMLAALASATRRGEYCALIDANDALDPHSLAAAGVDLDRLLWVRCGENSPRRHRDTEKTNREREFIANNGLAQNTIGKGTALGVPYGATNDSALATEGRRFHLHESHFKQMTDQTSKARTSRDYSGENSRTPRHSEHRLEQVLRATDLLLESGGFGLIILDLSDIPPQSARRIPLTTWFRFRRTIEHKPTILLAIEQQPIAGSCSSLLLQLGSQKRSDTTLNQPPSESSREATSWESPARQCRGEKKKENQSRRDVTISAGAHNAAHDSINASSPSHANLLTELKLHAELIRSRLDRKPSHSVMFETKTAWAG